MTREGKNLRQRSEELKSPVPPDTAPNDKTRASSLPSNEGKVRKRTRYTFVDALAELFPVVHGSFTAGVSGGFRGRVVTLPKMGRWLVIPCLLRSLRTHHL